MMGPWLVGVLVTLAAWCAVAPGGRRAEELAGRPGMRSGRRLGEPGEFGGRGRRVWWRPGRGHPEPDQVRVVVAQVVALLRSGASPGAAWSRALGVRVDAGGVPDAGALVAVVGDARAAAAVAAGARLARDTGAPLAGVLEAVAGAQVAQAEADADREASLAGPQTTARVLLFLPALGVLLGAVLGADPLARATDGGLGTAAVVLGVLALLAGRWWTGRLVAAARTAGVAP